MDWKEFVKHESTEEPDKGPLLEARRFFAVDASGSTAGSVIRAEGDIVLGFHRKGKDTVTKWGTSCEHPKLVTTINGEEYWQADCGATYPDTILQEPGVLKEIRGSDLWYLLTDGHIDSASVTQLTRLAAVKNVLHIPVVIIVIGRIKPATPDYANISVGLPFFASTSDSIILYKCALSGKLWAISAKGLFSPLAYQNDNVAIAQWEDLAVFNNETVLNERCKMLDIQVLKAQDRKVTKGISLGPRWDATTGALIDVDLVLKQKHLKQEDLCDLLEEDTFAQLAIICKMHDNLDALRTLLLHYKKPQFVIQLEDINGAGRLLKEMESVELISTKKDELRERLREAHIANRTAYQQRNDSPSDESKMAAQINRLIDRALCVLSDISKAGYTADILSRKSNRVMRAETISSFDSDLRLVALDLSDGVNAFRSTSSICCGEDQIMSAVLKKLESVEENTTDFVLNFPLAVGQAERNVELVSSQCTCFQCSLLLRESLYREELSARIPTVEYEGANKGYINDQLTQAITAGLKTGTSGIIQIFMTVLDKILQNKDWCAEKYTEDLEIMQRRQILDWMLRNLLKNCLTRETFSETGPWVKFPEALLWAVQDYQQAGLES